MEDGPLPPFGCEVVLLVRVGYEGVVGCHHRDVEVDKILEEGRFEGTGISRGDYSVSSRWSN